MRDILRWTLHWLSAAAAVTVPKLDVALSDAAVTTITLSDAAVTIVALSDASR
jgi:hypothetical protein